MKKILLTTSVTTVLLCTNVFGLDTNTKVNQALEKRLNNIDKRLNLTENYVYYSDELINKKNYEELKINSQKVLNQMNKVKKQMEILQGAIGSTELDVILGNVDGDKPDENTEKLKKLTKELKSLTNKVSSFNLLKESNKVLKTKIRDLTLQMSKFKKTQIKETTEMKNELNTKLAKIEVIVKKLLNNKNSINIYKNTEDMTVDNVEKEIVLIYKKLNTMNDKIKTNTTNQTNNVTKKDLTNLKKEIKTIKPSGNLKKEIGKIKGYIKKLHDKLKSLEGKQKKISSKITTTNQYKQRKTKRQTQEIDYNSLKNDLEQIEQKYKEYGIK